MADQSSSKGISKRTLVIGGVAVVGAAVVAVVVVALSGPSASSYYGTWYCEGSALPLIYEIGPSSLTIAGRPVDVLKFKSEKDGLTIFHARGQTEIESRSGGVFINGRPCRRR